ncbi:succinate dehydrogenase subunit [Diplonema papillatum]|nr:succinate dehydrogenase subunit [Diplonema papillatum]
MLRRCACRLALATPTATNVGNPNAAPTKPVDKYHFQVEREADTTKDLGARNEAAYFSYSPFVPTSLKERYAMPSLNNLLTSVVVEMAFIFGFSISVGILLWTYYCSMKYETVRIPYPTKQAE